MGGEVWATHWRINPAGRTTVFGMTVLKQAAFSIAFAVLTVAIAEYVMWILEQKGWLNP
jgi:hypothetical protein